MSDINENIIKVINRGRLDIYVPLKFETKYDYSKLCAKIHDSIDLDIKRYIDKFNKTLQNDYDDIKDKNYINLHGKLPFWKKIKRWVRHKKSQEENNMDRGKDGTVIEISNTERGLFLSINPGEMSAFNERQEQLLNEEFEQHKKLYGSEYTELHNRFVLLPLRVQLKNDKFVWLNSILFVFGNKMGALKIEIPLLDVSTQIFMDYDIDSLIKGAEDRFNVLDIEQPLSIKAIYNAYVRRLVNELKVSIVVQNDGIFRNLICTEFDKMPKRINNIPDNVKLDLFRIIAAPVQIMDGISYKEKVCEYFEKQSYWNNHLMYITSSTGNCLSITDASAIEWLKEQYKKESDIKEYDEECLSIIHKSLTRDLCMNIEFSILVLLLKHMNVSYSYGLKVVNPKEIHKIKSTYFLNLMFIADLQMGCYGTVSDQVNEFEKMMPHYLKEKISTQKMEAIDHILSDEENLRQRSIQNFLAFGSVVLTTLFGLPAISETIQSIRNACVFLINDIPIISIQNISITLWVVSILFFSFYTVNLNKNNSERYLKF